MATNKKEIKIYLGREVAEDLQLLYQIWEIRTKKRGISPSKNKFIEGILTDYVRVAKNKFIEEAKEKFKNKENINGV